MNKSELIEQVAAKAGVTKAGAARVLEATLESITETVASGNTVTIIGFGAFRAADRAAREGKNPRTGEKLLVAAARLPKFSAGSVFKAAVAKN